MTIKNIYSIYFSPTGGTKKITNIIAKNIAKNLNINLQEVDFTKLENRNKSYNFNSDDLVILGMPVYAGRIPNKICPDIESSIKGNDTKIIAVSVYGNRSYGDALREMLIISNNNGFIPIGAAAIVNRHTFSNIIAKNRPNKDDIMEINYFTKQISNNIKNDECNKLDIDYTSPIKPYYIPLKKDKTPAKFLKAKPITDKEKCNKCSTCINVCPMGSIDNITYETVGICIKCQACIKACPNNAKYFDDEDFLSHVKMLEENYMEEKENLFIIS